MTAYNGKYRCEGGQKPPIKRRGAWMGQCSKCGNWYHVYPLSGKVVMHKRVFKDALAWKDTLAWRNRHTQET